MEWNPLIRRVYLRDPLHTMLPTFGLALMIEDMIRMAWGTLLTH
jgi:branched-chain amino acid transport system permease protein